jgi:hypothetical protein
MDTLMRSSARIGPTPVWSLTNAARDIDSFVAGLPTAVLEALMKIEQDALASRWPSLATR